MMAIVGLAGVAQAIDDLRARPECGTELAALLEETSPIYTGGARAMPRGCAPTFSRVLRKARGPTAFCRSRWSRSTPATTHLPSRPPRKYYATRCGYPRALPTRIVGAIRRLAQSDA